MAVTSSASSGLISKVQTSESKILLQDCGANYRAKVALRVPLGRLTSPQLKRFGGPSNRPTTMVVCPASPLPDAPLFFRREWRTRPSLEARATRHGPTQYFMRHKPIE